MKGQKLDKIRLIHSDNITKITGNIGSTGLLVNEVDKDEIVTIISKKDEKILKDKRSYYFELWLIIIETDKAATWRDGMESLTQEQFETEYDKIFLYRYLYDKTVQLELKKKHNNGYRS